MLFIIEAFLAACGVLLVMVGGLECVGDFGAGMRTVSVGAVLVGLSRIIDLLGRIESHLAPRAPAGAKKQAS